MGTEDDEADKDTVKTAPDRTAAPGNAEKKAPKEEAGKGKGKKGK